MLFEGSNASTVLTWVRPDLDKHLNQIRTQLEHVANSTNIGDGVENTSRNLTQLKFTFQALVLQGATLVIEEMLTVCDELKRFNIHNRDNAFGALMDAIVIVPSYLDRLQAGHHDLPILLLPIINKLRSAYNANIVSEATLFAPSLDVPMPELDQGADEHPPVFDESFESMAVRMRRQYENALLKWLQSQENVKFLSPIHSVCETLSNRLERIDLRRLWWFAGKIVDGLLDEVTSNDVHLRRLFARLHLNIKTLAEGGEAATDPASVDSIAQALLFHVVQSKSGNAGVDMLRDRFNLEELVPDRDVLIRARGAVTGRNRELYSSLGAAVKDELSLVKDALDLELRTGKVEPNRRDQSHDALLRLKDTLKMMGLADSAQSIEDLMPAFEASAATGKKADGMHRDQLLIGLAEQLLQVESVLEEQIVTLGEPLGGQQDAGFIDLPIHEQRRIRAHLLDETVVSLHLVQDGVRKHFGNEQDADFVTPMEHIAGAIELIGDTKVASLILKLRNALGNLISPVRSEAAIAQDKLEAVTDAVAALELYLAGCRDQQKGRDRFLDILADRLEHLPVGEFKTLESPAQPPEPEEPQESTKKDTKTAADSALPATLDTELQKVFLEEFGTVLDMMNDHIPIWLNHPADMELVTEIRRGFHTLKGSGRMVGATELGDFAWRVEDMLNALLDRRINSADQVAVIIQLAKEVLPVIKQRLLQKQTALQSDAIDEIGLQAKLISNGHAPAWENLVNLLPSSFSSLVPGGKPPDAQTTVKDSAPDETTLQSLIRKELADNLARLKSVMERISRDRSSTASDDEIRALHSISGVTAQVPIGRESDLARALEELLEAQRISGGKFTDIAVWTIASSLAHLQTCLAIHEGDTDIALADDEISQIEQLQSLAAEFDGADQIGKRSIVDLDSDPEIGTVMPASSDENLVKDGQTDTSALEESPPFSQADDTIESEDESIEDADSADIEIIGIFLEEAGEILERSDSLLNDWRDNMPDLAIVQNLQREIHTFKGGARMSGLISMGDLSHAMETLLERIAGNLLPPTLSAIEALEQGCDRLNNWVEQVSKGQTPVTGEALRRFELQVAALTAVRAQPMVSDDKPARIDSTPEELLEIPDVAVQPTEEPATEDLADENQGTQQIRVDADLLDSLVNSAGEVSIFRSRLEQQVGNLRENLNEFDKTVSRLRDQFRKLEIETEIQTRSRYRHQAPEGSEEFDPLEMDRFSSMQQLSRGLSESVSDLLNLQELLDEAARNSEALLVQQSRVSTELQEGLMQTRMVHFGTIAARLRRIVRTASGEVRKKARLQLRMTDGGDRLDRNVLERITAPLEHLLRNSIVHGIESPAVRRKLKKPAQGSITITVAAEATEFVVRVEDDGAGLDLNAIRKRAVMLGLVDRDTNLQTEQLIQFILHSGFSTSKTVTGLAGRGIGMDVVNNEIKQIGGSIEISTETGSFTRFTIRIPFTLAVMQAIGVVAGDRRYLIPLTSVAGVARMLPVDYETLLEGETPAYEFADEQYTILELEQLLGEVSTPIGDDTISILMIKSGEHRAAFRVPELLGHNEIVIKPVGPQISSVPGILGGTITADGQVVIIIDAGPLIRQGLLADARPVTRMEPIDLGPSKTLAMVVDDSITMRKVTSRVLERHDFEVITARDGVDATEQLQEKVPDILLLDVEMPRMDGYAVAEHVRSDARLRKIPIIMITSRAGKKHRDRGRKAGANAYISKPYKESELMAEVTALLSK